MLRFMLPPSFDVRRFSSGDRQASFLRRTPTSPARRPPPHTAQVSAVPPCANCTSPSPVSAASHMAPYTQADTASARGSAPSPPFRTAARLPQKHAALADDPYQRAHGALRHRAPQQQQRRNSQSSQQHQRRHRRAQPRPSAYHLLPRHKNTSPVSCVPAYAGEVSFYVGNYSASVFSSAVVSTGSSEAFSSTAGVSSAFLSFLPTGRCWAAACSSSVPT